VFTIRRALAAAAAAAAALVLPAPAHAGPPPLFTFSVHDMGVSAAGKWTGLHLRPVTAARPILDDVRIVIDTAGVSDIATAWIPQFQPDGTVKPWTDCTAAGSVTTCSLHRLTDFDGYLLPYLVVQAKDGAELGKAGPLSVTFTAKDLAPIVTTPTITVADDIDLVAGPAGFKTGADLGKPVPTTIELANTGTKPVHGAVARFVAMQGLGIAGRYTNCEYNKHGDVAYCRFGQDLAPGSTYTLDGSPILLRADAKAGESHTYLHEWLTGDDAAESGTLSDLAGEPLTPGTSGVLHLVLKPASARLRVPVTDSNHRNNLAFGFVTPNAAGPGTTPPGPSASPRPAPSPSAGPPASPGATPSGSASPSTSATASPAAAPVPAGGGSLPVTGAAAGGVAVLGGGLLALGIAAAVAARRRRTDRAA
jgi:hypothetical protein